MTEEKDIAARLTEPAEPIAETAAQATATQTVSVDSQAQPNASSAQAAQSRSTARSRRALRASRVKQRRRGPKISTIVAIVVLLLGVGIMAYPTVSDWWNSYHQTRAIASYAAAVEETDPKLIESMFSKAEAYNKRLLTKENRYRFSDADKAEYESLLNLTGNGVMGYVQINSIGVDLPIYHGMDESVLQIAIGHLEGTSLPIGGSSTHSVISGHRGLPRAKLFTDLDRIVEGDTFSITVLDRTAYYEVDQIRVVLPEDMSNLNIQAGKDYCTLVTCTPYGINTHRMLVRGHRVESPEGADVVTPEAVQIPRYIAIIAVGVPILFIFLVGMLVYYRVRKPGLDKERASRALHERLSTKGGTND